MPDRLQRVGGLAGLRDRHDQRRVVEDRVAVAELRGQLHLDRHPGPVLDGVLGHHPGVERRAAGDDDDLVDVAELLVREPHLVELQQPRGGTPAEQRVRDRARLLEDLLAHEPVVALLLGRRQVPVDVVAPPLLAGVPTKSVIVTPDAGDGHDLVLAELERLAGVLDERRHVGAEEVLAVAEPDHQRRVAPGRDHRVDGSWASTATRVNAPSSCWQTRCIATVRSTPDSSCSSSSWAATSVSVSETRVWSSASSSGAELGEVLDDPVVHQRHPAGVARACGWALTSLGAPWVAQRVCPMPVVDAGSGASAMRLLEVRELAGLLRDRQPGRRPRRRSRRSRSRGTPAAAARRGRRPGPAWPRRTRRSRTWAASLSAPGVDRQAR